MSRSARGGNRLSRRMVALFIGCAMFPVAATLLVSYRSVNKLLVTQRVGLLREAASGYGVSLVERLNIAETVAQAIGDAYAGEHTHGTAHELTTYFQGGVTVGDIGGRVLFGRPSPPYPATRSLSSKRSPGSPGWVLEVVAAPGEKPNVWLVQRVAELAHGARRLALELRPKFLWAADQLPYLTSVCILGADRLPLHCSAPLAPATLGKIRALARGSNGDFVWNDTGNEFLSGFHEIFLLGRFGAPSWTVVATQPAAYALGPVRAVASLVLPVVVLGLLAAALLGMVLVRRALQPLKGLTQATARLGEGDFSVRVPATEDNELGVLADAFNKMSHRLGRQFSAMQAHSEINAVILSNVDLARVAAVVFRRIVELAPADRYWLLLSAGTGNVFMSFRSDQGEPATTPLQAPDRDRLVAATDDGVDSLDAVPEPYLFALPIMLGTELGGALALAYDAPQRPSDEDVALLRDLTDRIAGALATARRDEELHRRANFDPLTGLPNRSLAMDILARGVASAERYGNTLVVLFIDIDGFSDVNDSAGHPAGDQLLQQIAVRLRGGVRKSDTVARLGGDEFAIVLTEVGEPRDGALVAQHAIETLSLPYRVGSHGAFISASIGIAVYPNDGTSAEELLRHADLAMYKAKRSGRGQFAFFEASMSAEVNRRAELTGELRKALDEREFRLHYQPQLDLRAQRIVGAEALLRWLHPSRGLVPPLHFVAFAESSDLIDELGRWVLHAASAQFVEWRRRGLAVDHVAVNVSPFQLRRPGFAQIVAETLGEIGISASALRLELTESAILDSSGSTAANLEALNEIGVPLELDDFGTGYSSLAYLQRLPVAAVKLDQAFIHTIETSPSTQAVVQAAINMVHALGKTVIAEGVEQQGQMDLLVTMGCDTVQGYLVSAPAPAEHFEAFVADWQRRRATRSMA